MSLSPKHTRKCIIVERLRENWMVFLKNNNLKTYNLSFKIISLMWDYLMPTLCLECPHSFPLILSLYCSSGNRKDHVDFCPLVGQKNKKWWNPLFFLFIRFLCVYWRIKNNVMSYWGMGVLPGGLTEASFECDGFLAGWTMILTSEMFGHVHLYPWYHLLSVESFFHTG